MRHFYLCIDDTDDQEKNIGTGQIAEVIFKALVKAGCQMKYKITRHQLLLDDSIAYTSHNSSMCMEGESPLSLIELSDLARGCIIELRSQLSHPGLCVYMPTDRLAKEKLVEFGYRAKERVLTLAMAKNLADQISDLLLQAPAGNGNGQIGALAGIGLRISGNDGTFRGKIKLEAPVFDKVSVLKERFGVDAIWDVAGDRILTDEELVRGEKQVKLVLHKHLPMLAVRMCPDGVYELCGKAQVYEQTITSSAGIQEACMDFQWDNDRGEQWSEQAGTCSNCLYRRLTDKGMKCTKKVN